jgi:predicted transcriptional regulator
MPPRKSITLTEAELRLMKLLWERGESAVSDLVAAMPEGETLAYTSVLTTVRILEQKGYVRHRQEGRAFVYSPCVEEREASRSEIRHTMQRFFGNSRERLLLSLLGDDEIDGEELQRLKDTIAKAADDGGPAEPTHRSITPASTDRSPGTPITAMNGAPRVGVAADRKVPR